MDNSKLYINDSLCCEESYLRCAGLDVGDYTLKIEASSIRNWEEEWKEEFASKLNEELSKRLNRVYTPEQEEDPKYSPNYRLGFL